MPKRKATKPRLRVTLIIDWYGSLDQSGDEEREIYKKNLARLFPKRELVFTDKQHVDDDIDADLVVFDYGGVSTGNDLLTSNSRRLMRWLQDHPSSLVVIGSRFTYRQGIYYELADLDLQPSEETDEMPPQFPNLMVHEWLCFDPGSGGLTSKDQRLIDWFDTKGRK